MIFEEKQSLRTEIRRRLGGLDAEALGEASEKIRGHLVAAPEWGGFEKVGGYYALTDEPAVEALAWRGDRTWFFPRVEGRNVVFHEVREPGEMRRGSFGVMEPDPARCERVEAAELDVILVPGVAFDAEGRRLGRGRGFYDRLLERLPLGVRRWGVCFQAQVAATVPVEAHDAQVERVITEEGWL